MIKNAKTLHLNLVRTSELAECLTNSYRTQLTDIASNEQLKQEIQHCQSMILKLKSQIKLANYNLDIRHRKGKNMHISDPLSRLVYVSESDENDKLLESMQNDLVVAEAQQEEKCSDTKQICDIIAFHYKEKHCSPTDLKKLCA